MNISPINNSYNSYNNKTSFKRIYKVQVKHSLFPKPDELNSAFGSFSSGYRSLLNIIAKRRTEEVKNLPQNVKFRDRFKSLIGIIKEGNINICFDKALYSNFQTLKASTGFGKNWLALHLKMDEPKPIKEGYHTFFVYTGDDAKKFAKLDKQSKRFELTQKAYARAQEKLYKGEIEQYDYQYWATIFHAEEYDKAVRQQFADKKMTSMIINTPDDFQNKLCPVIYNSMPIYGAQNL